MGKVSSADFDVLSDGYIFFTNIMDQSVYIEALDSVVQNTERALDAGCGSGILTLKLANRINYVVGLDISRSMILSAKSYQRELKKDNVAFVVADLERLPFKKGTFDFVVSKATLHHTRLDVTVPGLRRLVRPGGRMVIFDLVTSTPRLDRSPIWQILRVIWSAPRYAITYGLHAMWRIMSFQMSPQWIRHVCHDRQLTPMSFRNIYSRFLPGCRFERNPKTPWTMVASWEATKANS